MATAIAFENEVTAGEQERAQAVQEMFRIVSGFWLSRAVQVAATLGIPDLLKQGPKSAEELAAETGANSSAMYRLLRALAAYGVLREYEGRRFGSTPMSELLRSDVPGSMRSAAMSELGFMHYTAWGHLMDSVRTGEIAFERAFGTDPWSYLQQHPERAEVFNDSMTRLTEVIQQAVAEVYDFSPYWRVVDIGGGQGRLLSGILSLNPAAQGRLFDSPQVIAQARRVLANDPAADRIEFVAGDFFDTVPQGGDLYTLKWIIHDWAEKEALQILRNVRCAMAPGARVLLLETVLPEKNTPDLGVLMDLNMLVMTGGRERTSAEYRDLLGGAGLRVVGVYPTKSPISIVEAVAA